MNILLDTHILIWALTDSPKLPQKAAEIILDPKNDIYISVLSLWEIEIKRLLKPDLLPITAKSVADFSEQAGFKTLPLKKDCIFQLQNLVRSETEPPHKDPFDRTLICQAIAEDMFFLTHDSLVKGYLTDHIQFV